MKILSNAECGNWLDSHRFNFTKPIRSLGKEGFVQPPLNSVKHVFHAPDDGWGQLLLSHQLAEWLGTAEIMLWITSWAAYQPEEMRIMNSFRRARGEHRRLIEAPGFLVDTRQTEDTWATSEVFYLMMTFNWQGFALRDDQKRIIWLADEIVEAHSYDQKASSELQNMIEALGISSIE